jgi:hypothetical protein
LLTLDFQTLALEWPDLEAEEIAREKAKKKKKVSFIVSDSEDDRKPKKRKRDREPQRLRPGA